MTNASSESVAGATDVTAAAAAEPNHSTRLVRVEQLGTSPGEIMLFSEPLSSLQLVTAAWRLPWSALDAHIPEVPGLYFLVTEPKLQPDARDRQPKVHVYVGEAGSAKLRIRQHHADEKRNGFRRLFCLSSSMVDINKAHVRALEKLAVSFARSRVAVEVVSNPPFTIKLGSYDEAIVSAAWAAGKRLLNAAGFPMEPPGSEVITDPARNRFAERPAKVEPEPRHRSFEFRPGGKTCFAGLRATLVETRPGEFELQPGAIFRSEISHKLATSIMDRRHKAMAGGLLEPIEGAEHRYRLVRPVTMSSLLVAASFLAGYAVGNEEFWVEIDPRPVNL